MMSSFLLLLLTLFTSVFTEKHWALGTKLFNQQNLGTVIYNKGDYINHHCWTNEELTVLNSRKMFQDLLPKTNVLNSQSDQFIQLLIDYLHIILESVHKLSIGKTKHLLLNALVDTMGGYLHVCILPIMKYSYYAGNIKYQNMKKLLEIFQQLKVFLRTDGSGWRKHLRLTDDQIKIQSIIIESSKNSLACSEIITYQTVKNCILKVPEIATVTIPLPYLDNEVNPNSIALPFQTGILQSLYSERSAFILVKYYIASVKCITSKSKTNKEVINFKADLHDWLQHYVYPHLDDENKWYPAFGGVLRVLNSVKETGLLTLKTKLCKRKLDSEYPMLTPAVITVDFIETATAELTALSVGNDETYNSTSFELNQLIAIGVASAVLVWILLGLTLLCYKCLKRNSDSSSPRSSTSSAPVSILFMSQYCKSDTRPSSPSDKSIREKLKNWFKKKLDSQYSKHYKESEDKERCLAEINYSSY